MFFRFAVLCLGILAVNGQTIKWWSTATLYQVYPRSLKDTNGDGVGDIKGITESIPHFIQSGIDCVWLSPIYKSPMKDFGYDISDYLSIDPIFGTWEDFLELSNALKAAGLKLVMDFVPNHTSDEHDWFIRSVNREDPYTNYYIWKDSLGLDANGTQIPPNNWLSAFAGSAWQWNDQRQQFYLHQFTVGQPDLDFRNPLVLQEMKNILRYWLDNGVDGFRIDAPPHIIEQIDFLDEPLTNDPSCPENQFCQLNHIYTMNQPETLDILREFRQVIDQYQSETGRVIVLMSEPSNLHNFTMSYYGTEQDPIMDFPFNFNLIYDLPAETFAIDIKAALDKWLLDMPTGKVANWVTGNHDLPRTRSRFGIDDGEFALSLYMIRMLLPGVSVTYYGEEINMENTFVSWQETRDPQGCNAGPDLYQKYSRDPARTPFQWNSQNLAGFTTGSTSWLPVNPNYVNLNLEDQMSSIRTEFTFYQRLAEARKSNTIRFGSLEYKSINNDVFAFTREIQADDKYLVIVNPNDIEVRVNVRAAFPQLPEIGLVYLSTLGLTTTANDPIILSDVILDARGGLVVNF
ncbi:maltase 1-like [Neocloeon triangulifer]|uniref:maltase 1-like n=1 Tax=Neocloeon triangulifer TaxID=2078957 RepID=UPI00286F2745|nr:maltase 1-like [Neocloeon triangulifer]